jgi:FkbM family methyltransferase
MTSNKKIWVQIGTYDGLDKFQQMARQEKPAMIILVEPNPVMNEQIKVNYEGLNFFIENVAITEVNKGLVKLSFSKYVKTRHPEEAYNKCFSLLPMNDWGAEEEFKSIEVPSMSFMELCEKYKITDIDFLQIDTEGYDSVIIRSIDFRKIKIKTIEYEQWYFDTSCYSRYGDKAYMYGKGGMRLVENLLTYLGYELTKVGVENIIARKI